MYNKLTLHGTLKMVYRYPGPRGLTLQHQVAAAISDDAASARAPGPAACGTQSHTAPCSSYLGPSDPSAASPRRAFPQAALWSFYEPKCQSRFRRHGHGP